MSSYPIHPIEELTGYHLPYLLAAEAGHLHYNHGVYPVHGVANNAMACYWGGLLADGDGGMKLTEAGRARLDEWRSSREGRAWLAREQADDIEEQPKPPSAEARVQAAPNSAPPAEADQLALFPQKPTA